jgi:hypothetical protein
MAKDTRLVRLILSCQLFKPNFYLNKFKKSNFNSNKYDSKVIDQQSQSIDFLNITMIHCYGYYDKKNNCLIYNFMSSNY